MIYLSRVTLSGRLCGLLEPVVLDIQTTRETPHVLLWCIEQGDNFGFGEAKPQNVERSLPNLEASLVTRA